MIDIIQHTISIIGFLLFVGYGVTALFLPQHLRKDMLWFMPWTGVALIAVYGALLSFAKVPMSLAAYIIIGLSVVSALYATFIRRPEKIPLVETSLLFAGFLTCYLIHLFPLFQIGYPTVISLGNVDPISYTNVADFFVDHTVWEGKTIPPYTPSIWAVGDLVHYSYRWGSAFLLSFFDVLLGVRSYEIFSIMITLLFAFSFPLLIVFSKQLFKRRVLLASIIIFLTYVLNSTLSYMLYHVFFGQFIFAGLYIYILILLFTHNDEEQVAAPLPITGRELLLGLLLSSVTTLYPEGLVFTLIPFIFVTGVRYLFVRDVRDILFFAKVAALLILINPVTFHTAVMQNMKIIFSTSKNTFIGWEAIRHATPADMLGIYNLYYYRKLPFLIQVGMTVSVAFVWMVGFMMARHKLWICTIAGMFILLLIHFVVNSPNFFLYHRTIIYSLFLCSALFAIGAATLLSRIGRVQVLILLTLFSALIIRSFHRSFFQFYHHRAVVDASLISFQKLAGNKSVPQPFYTSDVFLGEYNLWRRLWQEYMLTGAQIISNQNYPTEVVEKRLPKRTYILAEKNKLTQGDKEIRFSRKIWENEYYILGESDFSTEPSEIGLR